MCGLSVYFQKHNLKRNIYEDFVCSLKKINHRGPDDEGIVLINTKSNNFKIIKTEKTSAEVQGCVSVSDVNLAEYDLALGHKRLSIIDLSVCGHQPMMGNDGSWIIFNGEVYNYIEVREDLKKLGSVFKTNSDTEVILEAYRVWGKNCLDKFNGMWAFIIWDAANKKIFISNDRFGVKPLYYLEHEDGFNLVSETKQLSAFKKNTLTINTSYLDYFLKYGYLDVSDETIYQNVFRFSKSSYSIVDPQKYYRTYLKKSQVQYYFLKKKAVAITEKEAIEQLRELLHDAVKIRMRADVDYGFALSGGLDSSAILYTAHEILKKQNLQNTIKGFSAVFPGYSNADESAHVKVVEEDLNCKIYYSPAMDLFNIPSFETHVYHQDFPVTGTSYFAEWSVYQKVKAEGIKILFNGQGADEVFGGYHHHFYKYCRHLLSHGKVLHYLSIVKQYAELKGLPPKKIHTIVLNELKQSAQIKAGIKKFDNALEKHWAEISKLDDMLLADFNTYQLPLYLRADDRDSMCFSVESRHPFMDYRLVEFGFSLPNELLMKDGWQKYIIRKAMHEMPDSIRYRKDKKGYVTPQEEWIKKYKGDFETYLDYNLKVVGTKKPSKNDFYNYMLGAWLKVNEAKPV